MKACAADSAAKAIKKVGGAPDDGDVEAIKIQIPIELMNLLKKGQAYLINDEDGITEEGALHLTNNGAVQVDDEGCWWLSANAPEDEECCSHEIRLNRAITDI